MFMMMMMMLRHSKAEIMVRKCSFHRTICSGGAITAGRIALRRTVPSGTRSTGTTLPELMLFQFRHFSSYHTHSNRIIASSSLCHPHCPRPTKRTAAYFSTTTTHYGDTTSEYRYAVLSQQQEALMQDTTTRNNKNQQKIVALLQQWENLLLRHHQHHHSNNNTSMVKHHMQQLYDHWKELYHPKKRKNTKTTTTTISTLKRLTNIPTIISSSSNATATTGETLDTTNLPYQIMLQIYCCDPAATATSDDDPKRALQLLLDWEEALGGNLELTPRSKHYQMVLRNYARHCTQVVAAVANVTPNDDTPNVQVPTLLYPEAMDVAVEIMQHLQQTFHYPHDDDDNNEDASSSSSKAILPNLSTYHYVVRCIASAIKYHCTIRSPTNQHDENLHHYEATNTTVHPTVSSFEAPFEQLQAIMDTVIQEFRTGRTTTNNEFRTFLLLLADAIQADRDLTRARYRSSSHHDTTEKIIHSPTNHFHRQRRQEWFSSWFNLMDVGNVDIWLNLHDDLLFVRPNRPEHSSSNNVMSETKIEKMDTFGTNNTTSDNVIHQYQYGYFDIIDKTTAAMLIIMTMELENVVQEIKASVVAARNVNLNHQIGMDEANHMTTPKLSPTFDDCIGILETMTQGIIRLEEMIQSKHTLHVALPSGRHYNALINSWSNLYKLNHFLHMHGPTTPNANTTSYVTMIRQQQDSLLQRFSDQHEKLYSKNKTDVEHLHATNSWNQLMQAYLNAYHPDKVLELWQQNHDAEYGRIRKNQQSYDILFRAYGAKRTIEPEAHEKVDQARQRAQQAHSTLSKLFEYDPSLRKFEPTSEHFLAVMLTWARSYDYNAAIYCQQVFDRMVLESERVRSIYGPLEDMQDSSIDTFIPTAAHYRPLLTCWGYSKLPEATKRILHIYEEMKARGFSFDHKAYLSVVFALSRTKSVEGAEHAEQILDELENKEVSFIDEFGEQNIFIDTEHDNHYETSSEFQLRASLYRSCMYAWCYCGAPNAHKRCAQIFRRLLTAYEKSGWDVSLRPDSSVYATLIDSLTLDSSITDKREAAEQAEKILEQMEAQAAAGIAVSPNVRVYTAVMKAHCKSGDPDAPLKVEELVRRMKAAYETGNMYAKPDGHAMTLLLQSWGRSNVPNKAAITWGIHQQMQEAYDRGDLAMRPNPYSLGAILAACAHTKSTEIETKNETVKIALLVLNELDQVTNGCLNAFAFRNIFQVITNQIENKSDRAMHAQVVFQRCCEAGFVSDWIVETLRRDVPSLYFQLPKNSENKLIIPKSWSRNVEQFDMKHLFDTR